MATTYAAVSDVQALINTNSFEIGATSEPDTDQVQLWLNQFAVQVDEAAGLSAESSDVRDILRINPMLAGRVAFEVWRVAFDSEDIPAYVQAWLDEWNAWILALTEGDKRLPSVAGSVGRARIIPTKIYGLGD